MAMSSVAGWARAPRAAYSHAGSSVHRARETKRRGEEEAAKKRAEKSARASTTKKRIESYSHADKQRVNNPPVGLVTPDTDPVEEPRKTYAYDPHLDPQLVWAGKAERTSFEIPTVSLHVHE